MSEFSEGMAVGQSIGGERNNGWGDGWWILLLLLCGWGNGGWAGNGGGNQMVGYELGRVATTNDVASGFSTSTIMSTQRDNQLAVQQGFSDVLRSISECCCGTQRAIDGVNHNMTKNTCDLQNIIANSTRDIIDSQRCGTDRILNYLTGQEMDRLRAENQALRFQASQSAQNAYLIDQLRPTARPAYITCSPFETAYGRNGWNGYGNSCGRDCGCNG